jgi:hypothetical protein
MGRVGRAEPGWTRLGRVRSGRVRFGLSEDKVGEARRGGVGEESHDGGHRLTAQPPAELSRSATYAMHNTCRRNSTM